MMDKLFGIEKEDQTPPIKFREMKYSDIYVKSALPIFLINFSMYLLVLMIIFCRRAVDSEEIVRLKNLAKKKSAEKANENIHNV